jgi:lipid II:glycine glycyltransferase (peptidoglycan interpeptide bridge formation enzyme)
MDLKIIDDKAVWDEMIIQRKNSQFLQSWAWGVFQQMLGRDVVRIRAFEGDKPILSVQVILHSLPANNSYWYIPRGPVLHNDKIDQQQFFLKLKNVLRDHNSDTMFIKVDPLDKLEVSGETVSTTQPANELAVKLFLGEDKLLESMREKTRYNIRLSERKGVTVKRIDESDYALRAFPKIWELLQITAKRQGINTHARDYYETMLKTLLVNNGTQLFIAECENKIIAAHIAIGFGDSLYYVHGASNNAQRNLMAPHLLHWKAMQYGKEQGFNYYNFGGVSPLNVDNHKWQSLTHFKTGFGNDETLIRYNYPDAVDLVQRKVWYKVYRLVKSFSN